MEIRLLQPMSSARMVVGDILSGIFAPAYFYPQACYDYCEPVNKGKLRQ